MRARKPVRGAPAAAVLAGGLNRAMFDSPPTTMKVWHPWCRVCGWRKGGQDSWDGHACKCGLHEAALTSCHKCGGIGRIPYDVGSQVCPTCDGSGLVVA